LKKIIYNRINAHIIQILTKEQYGFRNNTDNATFALINEILAEMDKKHRVGGVFCDLSKAFDCVNRNILLSMLEFYGIKDTCGALITSYLSERYQRVAIKDKSHVTHYSIWKLVRHGVPQGSILSSLLFLLYINDLPTVLSNNANLVLYADGTSILITKPNPIEFANNVNKIFSDINKWFSNNLLSVNLKKKQPSYNLEQKIVKNWTLTP
jgi:hypothetical protein